jgi:hypothetical protein
MTAYIYIYIWECSDRLVALGAHTITLPLFCSSLEFSPSSRRFSCSLPPMSVGGLLCPRHTTLCSLHTAATQRALTGKTRTLVSEGGVVGGVQWKCVEAVCKNSGKCGQSSQASRARRRGLIRKSHPWSSQFKGIPQPPPTTMRPTDCLRPSGLLRCSIEERQGPAFVGATTKEYILYIPCHNPTHKRGSLTFLDRATQPDGRRQSVGRIVVGAHNPYCRFETFDRSAGRTRLWRGETTPLLRATRAWVRC